MSYLTQHLSGTQGIVSPLEQRPKDKSIGGFVGNIWGDVQEMVKGLGTLGSMAYNDVVSLGKEAVTLGKADTSFFTDDVVKSLDDLAKEYWDIYSPGGKKLSEYAYEDPLSIVGDVMALATGGAALAGKGATVASKVPGVSDKLAAVALGTAKADDLTGLSRFVSKMQPGRIQALTPEMEASGWSKVPAQGLEGRLDPLTLRFDYEKRIKNPVRRAAYERVIKPLTTVAVDDVGKRGHEVLEAANRIMQDKQAPLAEGAASTLATADKLDLIVKEARKYGVERVDKPWLADRKVKRVADKLFGMHSTRHIRERNEKMKRFDDLLKDMEQRGLDTDLLPNLLQKPGKVIGGWRNMDEIGQWVQNVIDTPEADPSDVAIAAVIKPHIDRYNELAQRMPDVEGFMDITATRLRKGRRMNVIDFHKERDALKSHIESFSDAVNLREMARAGQEIDLEAQAVADLRLAVDRELTNPLLERGLLYYEDVLDRAWRVEQYDNLKAMGRTADEAREELGGGYGRDLQRAAAEMGMQAPVYFPHLDAYRMKFSDFLQPKRLFGSVENVGRRKQNQMYLYENGRWITDPSEVYQRTAAQITKYLETADMVDALIARFGRRIDPARHDDFDAESERLYSPGAFQAIFRTKVSVEEAIADRFAQLGDDAQMSAILSEGGEAADAIASDVLADGLLKGISGEARRLKDVTTQELYAIPRVVADRIDKFTSVRTNWKWRMFFDAPINVWRSFVLAGTPRWVFYNLLGNMSFLKLQGGKLSDVLKYAVSPSYREAVKDLIAQMPEDIRLGVHANFFGAGNQYITHLGAAENTGIGQLAKRARETKPAKAGRWIAERVQHLNNTIEDSFRSASFLAALDRQGVRNNATRVGNRFIRSEASLRKAMAEGFDERQAVSALEEVNYFFNDYHALSPTERNIIRRFISPFYSFYKHIIGLMTTYPLKHPIRSQVIRNMALVANEINDLGPVPNWLEGSVPTENFGILGDDNDPQSQRFLNSRGINPFSALSQSPMDFMFGQMNPFLKTGYEQITGTNTMTGEPFTSPDVVQPFGSKTRYRIDPETLRVVPVERVAPGLPTHLANQIPQIALARDLLTGSGSRYGTGETIVDPSGAAKYDKPALQKVAQFLGLSTTDYDLLEYQMRRFAEAQAALKQGMNMNPQMFVGG